MCCPTTSDIPPLEKEKKSFWYLVTLFEDKDGNVSVCVQETPKFPLSKMRMVPYFRNCVKMYII